MELRALLDSRLALVAIAVGGLAVGGAMAVLGSAESAAWVWSAATIPVLLALIVEIVTSLRRGSVGLDLVAALSMSAALIFGEALAANVVALMYAGGQMLERFAEGRAKREMTALLGRVAHTAMRYDDGSLAEVAIETLAPGDRILVRAGEVLPVDGTLAAGVASIDASALTGESLPVTHAAGEEILSGATNAGNAFDLNVVRPAAESTYARIVKLVEDAQQTKAPVVRIADRWAVWFLVLTLVIAGLAWGLSGDRLRALAVLVVATPCPLILALPVALISGMSRAAKLGVLIKNGGALEALSRVRTAILDKTGTLTMGRASVADVRTTGGWHKDEVLRLAASLDQASHHVIAEALVKEARNRGLILAPPAEVREDAGAGLAGRVEGHDVIVGGSRFVADLVADDPHRLRDGITGETAVVAVAVDGSLAGIIVMADPLRPDAEEVLSSLRRAGISRIVLASGDQQHIVDAVTEHLSLDERLGDLSPEDKVALVRNASAAGPTLMMGDGVNDAPALAAATIGIAMGARGSAASSESAGIVLLVDELERVARAVEIAHRTRRIALQSVAGGLALSVIGMIVAAFGYLPPVAGALTQEAIDVAVILNALRVLR